MKYKFTLVNQTHKYNLYINQNKSLKCVVEFTTESADLLTQSEKNQQADCIRAEKSGYYEMNEVLFLSCSFKMEKNTFRNTSRHKKTNKNLKKYLTAHVRGLKMTPKKAFNFRHFVLHFLIT